MKSVHHHASRSVLPDPEISQRRSPRPGALLHIRALHLANVRAMNRESR